MRSFAVIDAPQRSEAWFKARLGRLTGSRAKDMLAVIKSGEAASRRDLRMQLVVERLTDHLQEDTYVNAAIQRGIDCEPLAFAAYEARTGHIAERSGFLMHLDHLAGCSLDGHVDGFTGIVELKCPKSATHFAYLRNGGIPTEHLPQITHGLWVTGAEWCDFLSFDNRFPPQLQTFLVRVWAKDLDIAGYEKKALAFLEEVAREVDAAKGLTVLEGAA